MKNEDNENPQQTTLSPDSDDDNIVTKKSSNQRSKLLHTSSRDYRDVAKPTTTELSANHEIQIQLEEELSPDEALSVFDHGKQTQVEPRLGAINSESLYTQSFHSEFAFRTSGSEASSQVVSLTSSPHRKKYSISSFLGIASDIVSKRKSSSTSSTLSRYSGSGFAFSLSARTTSFQTDPKLPPSYLSTQDIEILMRACSVNELGSLNRSHSDPLTNKSDPKQKKVSPEEKIAVRGILFSLESDQQIAHAQQHAQYLATVDLRSSVKKLIEIPDIHISKYIIDFTVGTDLRPLAEVHYEPIIMILKSPSKAVFEVELQPESKWPQYKFTIFPQKGVLKKGKPQTITVSFVAQQETHLDDVIAITINGSFRYFFPVRANVVVPVFGVPPSSLKQVSLKGLRVPRILDYLRSYLTDNGGLKLPNIFIHEPESMLCYALRQQLNSQHSISAKATPETLYCVAHLIKSFYNELPQPLLSAISFTSLSFTEKDAVKKALQELSPEYMALFAWLIDLILVTLDFSTTNNLRMDTLAEQFATCLDRKEKDKVQQFLIHQISQSAVVGVTTHRSISKNQVSNHSHLKAVSGKLLKDKESENERKAQGEEEEEEIEVDEQDQEEAEEEAETQREQINNNNNNNNSNNNDPQLLPGWKLFYTKTPRARAFYYNTATKKSQWKKPTLPTGWTVHRTKTPRQRYFYHNKTLGKTQWEMPTD